MTAWDLFVKQAYDDPTTAVSLIRKLAPVAADSMIDRLHSDSYNREDTDNA